MENLEKLKTLSKNERKKILVTGTSGFIGRRLANELVSLGHDVYGLERYVAGRTIYGQKSFKTMFADLNDSFGVKQLVREVRPQIVFHVGALSPVAYSYNHPIDVNMTNYLASINLAETCMREGTLEHFLWAGTSEEYGNQPSAIYYPLREEYTLRPNSPYAVSKVAFDIYLKYLSETYAFPATIVRPFNSYGRMGDTHFLVENIISQMLKGNTLNLGEPEAVRDLMYVSDHVNGYLSCFLQPEKSIGEAFNFCTGIGWTIPEVAHVIAGLLGWNGQINWNTIPKRPNDIMTLVGSPEKAKTLLGWEAKNSLEEGLTKAIRQIKEKIEIK